jgi:hypothetical protein
MEWSRELVNSMTDISGEDNVELTTLAGSLGMQLGPKVLGFEDGRVVEVPDARGASSRSRYHFHDRVLGRKDPNDGNLGLDFAVAASGKRGNAEAVYGETLHK